MSGADLQEALALGVVALVLALAIWRRTRRKKSAGACSNCDTPPTAKPRESTLRFFKRQP
jgi:hypothetical protein